MRVAMVAPKDANPPRMSVEMTFAVLLRKWQASNEIRLKGGTKTRYENLINSHIIPELGELKLSEVNAETINGFLNEKLMRGRLDGSGDLSPSYVRSISLVITSALNYAVTEGYIQAFKNRINKPSIAKSELPILSIENQKVLEQHISAELTPTSIGILISLYTGLRIGEICALCWNDIDLNARTIYVRHTVSRIKSTDGNSKTELILDEPKTASSKRVVPIPSPLFYALVEYRKAATSIYVVSSTDSFVSPRTYDARYHRLLSDCHLEDLNYHGLRHTFATRCIEAGVDVKSLALFDDRANYKRALQFADDNLRDVLETSICQVKYRIAKDFISRGNYSEAQKMFETIKTYKDSANKLKLCNDLIYSQNQVSFLEKSIPEIKQKLDKDIKEHGKLKRAKKISLWYFVLSFFVVFAIKSLFNAITQGNDLTEFNIFLFYAWFIGELVLLCITVASLYGSEAIRSMLIFGFLIVLSGPIGGIILELIVLKKTRRKYKEQKEELAFAQATLSDNQAVIIQHKNTIERIKQTLNS